MKTLKKCFIHNYGGHTRFVYANPDSAASETAKSAIKSQMEEEIAQQQKELKDKIASGNKLDFGKELDTTKQKAAETLTLAKAQVNNGDVIPKEEKQAFEGELEKSAQILSQALTDNAEQYRKEYEANYALAQYNIENAQTIQPAYKEAEKLMSDINAFEAAISGIEKQYDKSLGSLQQIQETNAKLASVKGNYDKLTALWSKTLLPAMDKLADVEAKAIDAGMKGNMRDQISKLQTENTNRADKVDKGITATATFYNNNLERVQRSTAKNLENAKKSRETSSNMQMEKGKHTAKELEDAYKNYRDQDAIIKGLESLNQGTPLVAPGNKPVDLTPPKQGTAIREQEVGPNDAIQPPRATTRQSYPGSPDTEELPPAPAPSAPSEKDIPRV